MRRRCGAPVVAQRRRRGVRRELPIEPGDLPVDQRPHRRRGRHRLRVAPPTSRSRRGPSWTGSSRTSGRRRPSAGARAGATTRARRGGVRRPGAVERGSTGPSYPLIAERRSPAASCALDGEPVAGHRRGQPVGPGREEVVAEQAAEPVELGAQGGGSAVLLVEEHGELVTAEAGRRRGQQRDDLAVPAGQPELAEPVAAVGERDAAPRCGRAARARPGSPEACGAASGRGRWRASSASASRAAARTIAIVWGTTTSSPPVTSSTPSSWLVPGSWIGVAAQLHERTLEPEVFVAGHDRVATGRQRQPGCVGAGQSLVPVAALDEPDPLGLAQRLRVAADPEQVAVGVGERHHRAARPHLLAEHVVEQREDARQRVRLALPAQVRVVERDRGVLLARCRPRPRPSAPRTRRPRPASGPGAGHRS